MKAAWPCTGARRSTRRRAPALVCAVVASALAQLTATGPALLAEAEQPPQPSVQPALLSFNLADVAAAEAIRQIGWMVGSIVFEPPPDVRVTLSLNNVTPEAAVTELCRALGYGWQTVGRTYVLTPAERSPLLPTLGFEERVLYADRQRLDAARLMLSLTPAQIAQTAVGGTISYPELSAGQRELLGGIYTRLIGAARAGWIPGAPTLIGAPSSPPDALAFGIHGYIWRIETPPAPAQPAAAPPTPAPAPAETIPGEPGPPTSAAEE